MMDWHPIDESVVSVRLVNGCLEVVKRRAPNAVYGTGSPMPDRVWKEIYVGDSSGAVVLSMTVEGKHKPAYRVPESITFGEG